VVLSNVRRQLRLNRPELVREVRSHGDLSLVDWLREAGRELGEVFARNGSWTALRRAAGLPTAAAGPLEDELLKRTSVLAHVDDPERAGAYTRLLSGPVDYTGLSAREQRYARMLFFSLWPNGNGFAGYQAGFDALTEHPPVCDEFRQVIAIGLQNAKHVPLPLELGLQQVTLQTHAHYSRDEILAALDWADIEGETRRKTQGHATGVLWAEASETDALLVTLNKDEKHHSPETMYRDYALSRELFHWESQNTTTVRSAVGQRYLHHREQGTHVLLFARQTRSSSWGGAGAYQCLGPASYVSHESEQPIAITWRLRHLMPVETFRQAGVAG